ncbi:uncharacterized protein LOC118737380 [Rhagoletis pomonella]|uniref:uncharacterized protein LOC118737380 n=1 Tax=Rhagoletis pomonella TaxID=28610 RepID=UPI001785874D|nr:uncharacterized protein LOC118737380 [Rhagoletis pomonella]
MKHQQVVVDYWNMIKASFTCLLLAFFGYILIKMVQTIFWLPGYLQTNQKRLEQLAAQYSLELDDDKSMGGDIKAKIEKIMEESQLMVGGEEENRATNAEVSKIQGEPKKQK